MSSDAIFFGRLRVNSVSMVDEMIHIHMYFPGVSLKGEVGEIVGQS